MKTIAMTLMMLTFSLLSGVVLAAEPAPIADGTGDAKIYYCETKVSPPQCFRLGSNGERVPLAVVDAIAAAQKAGQAKKIYKCYVEGYDPPVCEEVKVGARAQAFDAAGMASAVNAAAQYKEQRAVGVDEPILNCHNGHGHSACCKIIAQDPITGTVYIECGAQ